MTPSELLTKARHHVAGGWHEPLSLDAAGHICGRNDEGITRFCLLDAMLTAAGDDLDALFAAEAGLVEKLHRDGQLGEQEPFYRWLEAPTRTQGDVLLLLAQVTNRLRAQEGRAA